ncbi:MAG: SulP family inorganic anion transporter [Acidimicrobiia bacterium]|nr:SulP family inorganic anion transporter [Acidimicrobiia bacterium]
MALLDLPRPRPADLIAGISVALVLIPQSLAYAQIADMPVVTGLFASALPLIAAAPFGSSPYLQTGPVALTSLLTFATLTGAGLESADPDYVMMAGVLALLVGVFRLVLGLIRAGWVAYLICEPVMMGFTSAAAVIILSSQLPKALGTSELAPAGKTLNRALWSVLHPESWQPMALAISAMTLVAMLGGRRLHRLFPGIMVAVVIGLIVSASVDNPGLVVGEPVGIPEGLPDFGFDVPLDAMVTLALGGLVIALVGYAEPASISRLFASVDRIPWNSNRELVGQGVANIAAAFSGAFPVGGSFSRSAVNRMAGAKTKWSGGVTGLVILAFLPFAGVLDPLPQAVLGAIVVGAVLSLLQLKQLLGMWRRGWIDALLCWSTSVATLVLAPNVQWAVVVGVALSALVHVIRPLRLRAAPGPDGKTMLEPSGLLWIGSYRHFARQLRSAVADNPGDVILAVGSESSLDPAVKETVAEVSDELAASGRRLTLV